MPFPTSMRTVQCCLRCGATVLAASAILAAWAAAAEFEQPVRVDKPPAPETTEPAPPPKPIEGPRDVLEGHGIDESQFNRLLDGQPIGDDDLELLLKVVFWIREFQPEDVERWAKRTWEMSDLSGDPAKRRGEMFLLSGELTRCEAQQPAPEVVERLELPRWFRCQVRLGPQRQPAAVVTEHVPKAWLKEAPAEACVGAFGLFVKLSSDDPQQPVPVFVAPRLAWYPTTPLGELGMDAGLLDTVEPRKALTARDREAFYQMLAAVGRSKPGGLLRQADADLEQAEGRSVRFDREGKKYFAVAPLFDEAAKQTGRLFALEGVARRVQEIPVEDADVRARFGIERFYEIELFTDDAYDIEGRRYPVTFCVRELPQGMPVGDVRYGETVRVAGFFFKTWAFHVPAFDEQGRLNEEKPTQVLPAPLLIGRDLLWYPAPQPSRNVWRDAALGTAFVVVVLGVWMAVWLGGRRRRAFRREELPASIDVPSVGEEGKGGI